MLRMTDAGVRSMMVLQMHMCGGENGAASQILSEDPRAFITHSFGHALNLAVADTVI